VAEEDIRVPAFAIAGIGNPQRFFDQLAALGFEVKSRAFSDHHAYSPAELAYAQNELLLMTEKDAVKCQHFAGRNWWYLQVRAELPPALEQDMIARIGDLLWTKNC
jgi:tetraacyldisaccharide 4'-kinase